MSLLKGMTERQQQGVMVNGVPAIVTAGAGAGKTRVLTTKIAKTLAERVINVLAFSFTNQSAGEIKERVKTLVDADSAKRAECCTFHSFALNYILKPNLDHPFFAALKFEKKIDICANNQAYLREAWVNGVGEEANDFIKENKYKMGDFISWLTQVRANASTITEYAENLTEIPLDELERHASNFEDSDQINAYYLLMWRKYQSLLRSAKQIDFDEVLSLSLQLLDHDPKVGERLRRAFGLILVDEFQDTNLTQYRMILHLINADASNLIIYGDIQQAIYGFRGGSSYIMAQFPDEFPNTNIVNLPDNFRSTQAIVGFANILAQQMKHRISSEDMIAHKDTIEPVTVVGFDCQSQEADWIAQQILTLKSSGINPSDIGILYRNKSHKEWVELELTKRKINYLVVDDKGLFELEEIKSIVAFLHCIFNPSNTDALKKALKTIGLKLDSKRLSNYLRTCKQNGTMASTHALLSKIQKMDDKTNKVTLFANKMISVIMSQSSKIIALKTPADFFRECSLSESEDSYQEYANHLRGFCDGLVNVYIETIMCFHSENIEQVTQKAEMEREQVRKNFSFIFKSLIVRTENQDAKMDLLDHIQSMPLFSDIKKDKKNTDCVELMTVHKSKGLEKTAIFLCGATQENWFKEINELDEDDKEEVLRLFYVACTRAIQYQYVTHFASRFVNNEIVAHEPIEYLNLLYGDDVIFRYYKKGSLLTAEELKNTQDYDQFEAGGG